MWQDEEWYNPSNGIKVFSHHSKLSTSSPRSTLAVPLMVDLNKELPIDLKTARYDNVTMYIE